MESTVYTNVHFDSSGLIEVYLSIIGLCKLTVIGCLLLLVCIVHYCQNAHLCISLLRSHVPYQPAPLTLPTSNGGPAKQAEDCGGHRRQLSQVHIIVLLVYIVHYCQDAHLCMTQHTQAADAQIWIPGRY